MRLFLSSIFIFISIGAGISFGEEYENKKSIRGIGEGTVHCYDFLHPADGYVSVARDNYFFAWAQGYMTGKNAYSKNNIHLDSMKIEEQLIIMKIYCEEHKRDLVWLAVEHLYSELSKNSNSQK